MALTKDEIPDSDNVLIITMDNPDDPHGGIDTTEVDKIIK